MPKLIAKCILTFVLLFTVHGVSSAQTADSSAPTLPINAVVTPGIRLWHEPAQDSELSANADSDSDIPSEAQFQAEDILLRADDVFSGSTLIEMLPDFPAFLSNLHYPSNGSECCKCTKFAAKKVLEHVLAHVKKICDTTKCPHIQKQCEWMAKHPKYSLGALIYHVRPHSLGFSYCIGAGKCKHHDSQEVLDQKPAIGDPIGSEMLLELMERNQSVSDALAVELTPQDVEQLEDNLDHWEPSDKESDGCKLCVHWVSFLLMKHHVENFVKLCKDTPSPIIKAHCKWVAHNFSMWLGMSTAYIRPDEFSFGFCLGQHSCESSQRHRHQPSELQPSA